MPESEKFKKLVARTVAEHRVTIGRRQTAQGQVQEIVDAEQERLDARARTRRKRLKKVRGRA